MSKANSKGEQAKLSNISAVRNEIESKLKLLEESYRQNVIAIQDHQNVIADLDTSCKEIRGAIAGLTDLLRSIDGGVINETGNISKAKPSNNEE